MRFFDGLSQLLPEPSVVLLPFCLFSTPNLVRAPSHPDLFRLSMAQTHGQQMLPDASYAQKSWLFLTHTHKYRHVHKHSDVSTVQVIKDRNIIYSLICAQRNNSSPWWWWLLLTIVIHTVFMDWAGGYPVGGFYN